MNKQDRERIASDLITQISFFYPTKGFVFDHFFQNQIVMSQFKTRFSVIVLLLVKILSGLRIAFGSNNFFNFLNAR